MTNEHVLDDIEASLADLPTPDTTENDLSGDPFLDYVQENLEADTGIPLDGFATSIDAYRMTFAVWASYGFLDKAGTLNGDGTADASMSALRHQIGYNNILVSTLSARGLDAQALASEEDNTVYNLMLTRSVMDSLRLAPRIAALMIDEMNEKYARTIQDWVRADTSNPANFFGDDTEAFEDYPEKR